MGALLSWVDFSPSDRDRMRRAIALFQERSTVDELGLGTIRDVFAEAFFPGTSTIMTRLRYFLFVPWVYRNLEASRATADDVAQRARTAELALVDPIDRSEDALGNIGRVARESLLRLPSSTYWAGLQRWRVCCFAGTQDEYHRQFDAIRDRRRHAPKPDDDGVTPDRSDTWHPRLPEPPPGWPDEVSFHLTRAEAEFLQGRIAESCSGTPLAILAMHGRKADDVDYLWESPDLARMPTDMRALVDLARRFSLVMHGAALLYNLMLSEQKQHGDWTDSYRAQLDAWARSTEAEDLQRFDPGTLFTTLDHREARIPSPTRRFVTTWAQNLASRDPRSVATDDAFRLLVKDRERTIKGARSRFTNRRALDQWGGASGAWRLSFRWPIARRLLNDLHTALSETR